MGFLRVRHDQGIAVGLALDGVAQAIPGVDEGRELPASHQDAPCHSPEGGVRGLLDVRLDVQLWRISLHLLWCAGHQRATTSLADNVRRGLLCRACFLCSVLGEGSWAATSASAREFSLRSSAGPLVACCLGVLPGGALTPLAARFLLTAELADASEPALGDSAWSAALRAPGFDLTQSGSTQRPWSSNVLHCGHRGFFGIPAKAGLSSCGGLGADTSLLLMVCCLAVAAQMRAMRNCRQCKGSGCLSQSRKWHRAPCDS